jgi:hypothetical protein
MKPGEAVFGARRQSMVPGAGGPRGSIMLPRPSISGGPSLAGLLASKRFARRMTGKFMDVRKGSILSSIRSSENIQKEPTYRMEPSSRFSSQKVHDVIKDVLEDKLEDYKYHPKFSATMAKVLSDDVRMQIKDMDYDRYKIVVLVHLGQQQEQGVNVASRCCWDDKNDDVASYTFIGKDFFCTTTVYGIYME